MVTGAIAVDSLTDELGTADVALVLGNKVEANGQPSDRLRARLDKAVELYDRETLPWVIVSGGIDSNGTEDQLYERLVPDHPRGGSPGRPGHV